jgi:hypothetical protein
VILDPALDGAELEPAVATHANVWEAAGAGLGVDPARIDLEQLGDLLRGHQPVRGRRLGVMLGGVIRHDASQSMRRPNTPRGTCSVRGSIVVST